MHTQTLTPMFKTYITKPSLQNKTENLNRIGKVFLQIYETQALTPPCPWLLYFIQLSMNYCFLDDIFNGQVSLKWCKVWQKIFHMGITPLRFPKWKEKVGFSHWSLPLLRDACPVHYRWIFGKVPNGLWPPPRAFFGKNVAIFCYEIFWNGNDPPKLASQMLKILQRNLELFQKFIDNRTDRRPYYLRQCWSMILFLILLALFVLHKYLQRSNSSQEFLLVIVQCAHFHWHLINI